MSDEFITFALADRNEAPVQGLRAGYKHNKKAFISADSWHLEILAKFQFIVKDSGSDECPWYVTSAYDSDVGLE